MNIICIGYPKAGTTWLTRLTAELIHAPVIGFWGEPNNYEVAIEGETRRSDYRVHKAHQQYKDLNPCGAKLIYIRRHIKDVIISGQRYFHYDYDTMRLAVTHGIDNNAWMRVGMKEHLEGYLGKALIVSYEELYFKPEQTCKRILYYLNLSSSYEHIRSAIINQSFENKKRKFEQAGDNIRADLMVVGKPYQYRG